MSNAAQLSARERIMTLLDENSFVEIGALVTQRSTNFSLGQKSIPSDGVITGYGLIEGNPVYVYSQDSTILGGSIGEMHAKKIANLYDMALKVGAPIIGCIDSSGMRLEEATDALNGFGEIYLKQTMASGVIPQIVAIFGNSGGGLAILASLSDFSFISENSCLFVNSPNSLASNHIDKTNTSTAKYQGNAGNVDYIGETEEDVLLKIRELVTLLPPNNKDTHNWIKCTDDLNRLLESFELHINDPRIAFSHIGDHYQFFELKPEYGKDMVTGFLRLNGALVGAIGNRTELIDADGSVKEKYDGVLTTDACEKATAFLRFCDSFEIPILTLTNVHGYKATLEEERTISKAVAKLIAQFASASVPKINLIAGNAYGSAYIAMNSKHIGADLVYALPSAKIGMMDSTLAAQILYAKESEKSLEDIAKAYEELQNSPISAASRGYIDAIIEPESVRKHILYGFEMLYLKSNSNYSKKHSSK